MAEIVTITGHDCDPRKASQNVICLLEELLERANAGEITGIAVVSIQFDRTVAEGYAGQVAQSAVIGALTCLAMDLAYERSTP